MIIKNKKSRDVPLDVIERGLKDDDWRVRCAAMNACQGRDVPLDMIERGIKDDDFDVRHAAMNACQGRDVPLEVIERWLKDDDWRVRYAAMKIAKDKDVEIPPYRTFEPPKQVYKKCLNDVIVVAEIPADAEVRGKIGQKCRSNKAKIVDVIGDFCGEKIGFSLLDRTVFYMVGDEIEVENFDYSDKECSQGFHFFCSQKEAENYNS